MKKYEIIVDFTAVGNKIVELEDDEDIEEYLDNMSLSAWNKAEVDLTYIDAYEWTEID